MRKFSYVMAVRRSNQSGFTLLELMVVIGILGIMAATAIRGGNTSQQRAGGFAKGFASDLRWARQRAIVHGTHYDVHITGTNQYEVRRLKQNGTNWDLDVVIKTVSIPSGVTWTANTNTGSHYQFNTRGMQVAYTNLASATVLYADINSTGKLPTHHQVSIWPSGQAYEEY